MIATALFNVMRDLHGIPSESPWLPPAMTNIPGSVLDLHLLLFTSFPMLRVSVYIVQSPDVTHRPDSCEL